MLRERNKCAAGQKSMSSSASWKNLLRREDENIEEIETVSSDSVSSVYPNAKDIWQSQILYILNGTVKK
jgi:hypothetical protein